MKDRVQILFKRNRGSNREEGFLLIEILVALLLLSIVAAALTLNAITASKTLRKTIRHSVSSQLANTKMEELLAVNPVTLDDSDDLLESGIIVDNIAYDREVDVTVNPDDSRTLVVIVALSGSTTEAVTTLVNSVSLWGTQ